MLLDGLPLLAPEPMLVKILLAETSRELFAPLGIEGGFKGLVNDCSSVWCVGVLNDACSVRTLVSASYSVLVRSTYLGS